ncbi:MarR family transcriptional regulator [Paenibacillus sp. CAA11]|uniref:MarR family winged helix-turn-helix transcriptional regulator n=1 Tax=Paenibacillus sp. CAA11 TaxID=1532905 RepID=UPI000D3BBB6C|nr:MarR family winged helix-turn-helix transcriptional regulator [Paenibacillus sp. CAA11]AWB46339.1 MarR family transcriptional regulator [Paenibacillus sp. CAA11]
MEVGGNPTARKLIEAFDRFRKSDWRKPSIDGHRPSELRVLFHIQRGTEKNGKGMTVSEISSKLEVTSPTVTQLIKSLEAEGLVERRNDLEDRRVVRVRLTEEGNRLSKRATEAFYSNFTGLYAHLGEEQSAQLADLLGKVYEYLEEKHRQDKLQR